MPSKKSCKRFHLDPKKPKHTAKNMVNNGLEPARPLSEVKRLLIILEDGSVCVDRGILNRTADKDKPRNPAIREVRKYHKMTDPTSELARPLSAREAMAGLKARKIKTGTSLMTTFIPALRRWILPLKVLGMFLPVRFLQVGNKVKISTLEFGFALLQIFLEAELFMVCDPVRSATRSKIRGCSSPKKIQ